MQSTVDICNMALGFIGERPIASLEEKKTSAEACKLYYPMALNQLLRAHPWNFAEAREKLAPVKVPEEWGREFSHAYAYPDKCIILRGLVFSDGSSRASYRVGNFKGRRIILCHADKAVASFTQLVEDSSNFDPSFAQALARKLQGLISRFILKNTAQIKDAEELYQMELEEAKLRDSKEGKRQQAPNNYWHGGHGDWETSLSDQDSRWWVNN